MNASLKTLQANASGFFDKVQNKHVDKMVCKAGCSKCCYVDLSVFTVEANLIRDWFQSLTSDRQNELRTLWRTELKDGENANGKKEKSCAFLKDEMCTIYEARPLICRTQGAPLFFQELNSFDVCPLNFSQSEIPPREDWLNVDRLNTLLAMLQGESQERVRLFDLMTDLLS